MSNTICQATIKYLKRNFSHPEHVELGNRLGDALKKFRKMGGQVTDGYKLTVHLEKVCEMHLEKVRFGEVRNAREEAAVAARTAAGEAMAARGERAATAREKPATTSGTTGVSVETPQETQYQDWVDEALKEGASPWEARRRAKQRERDEKRKETETTENTRDEPKELEATDNFGLDLNESQSSSSSNTTDTGALSWEPGPTKGRRSTLVRSLSDPVLGQGPSIQGDSKPVAPPSASASVKTARKLVKNSVKRKLPTTAVEEPAKKVKEEEGDLREQETKRRKAEIADLTARLEVLNRKLRLRESSVAPSGGTRREQAGEGEVEDGELPESPAGRP